MNRRGVSFLVGIATVLLVCATVRGDDLLAHGTSEMFWVARVAPADARGREPAQRTIIRGRAIGGDAQWTVVAQLGSRVVSLASRGTELAALLDSGNWMLLWPGGSSMGALPDDGASLLMLASDADSIWSLGTGGRAVAATTSATQVVEPERRGWLALYRLERGRWRRQGWLPEDLTLADLPRLSITVLQSMPTISVLRSGGSIQSVRWEKDYWETLEPLSAPDVRQLKLISDGRRALLWAAPEAGAGRVYSLSEKWSEPKHLEMNDPPGADEPRTIAFAGNNLRFLFIRERRVLEQTYDPNGKPVRAEPTALPAGPARPDATPNRVLTLAAAALLMLVVLGSLRRGGGAASTATALAAGLAPAPLLFRFVAGVVDATPLIIPCWFIFKDIDPSTEDVEALIAATSWPFYIALASYLLYTWLSETIFDRTIGKLLFGMRVVALDGSRPSRGAIFARNALRLVDVTMLTIPLILVVLSPLRQRVGDIAARTVVVSGAPRQEEDAAP